MSSVSGLLQGLLGSLGGGGGKNLGGGNPLAGLLGGGGGNAANSALAAQMQAQQMQLQLLAESPRTYYYVYGDGIRQLTENIQNNPFINGDFNQINALSQGITGGAGTGFGTGFSPYGTGFQNGFPGGFAGGGVPTGITYTLQPATTAGFPQFGSGFGLNSGFNGGFGLAGANPFYDPSLSASTNNLLQVGMANSPAAQYYQQQAIYEAGRQNAIYSSLAPLQQQAQYLLYQQQLQQSGGLGSLFGGGTQQQASGPFGFVGNILNTIMGLLPTIISLRQQRSRPAAGAGGLGGLASLLGGG